MSPFRMAAASCAGRCWYNTSSIPATFGGAELSGKRCVSTREGAPITNGWYRCKICDKLRNAVYTLRMAIWMDLRIKKTYRALFDAFTELLEEHRFEDLTVAMLCDRALIRRTTFYKHFRDKNDYFAFYIDELMSGLPQKRADADGAEGAEDVRALRHEVFADAMDLILAHEQLMDNILASSMSGMLTNVICDRICPLHSRACDERACRGCPGARFARDNIGVYRRWHYSTVHKLVGVGSRS